MKYFASPIMHRLYQRFAALYGNRASTCVARMAMLVNRYGVGAKVQKPASLWSELDTVLITYGDSIRTEGEKPLHTLSGFLSERLNHTLSGVHVLPFFPYSSDDGFSITDYREVRPDLGDWKDISALAGEYRLMVDLVLNHCSRQSAWFNDYVAGILPAKNYFIEMDPKTDLSDVVRPRTSPLLSKTNTRAGEQHLWTTFSEDQVDLDFSNPDVLFEFLDILFFHISTGARIVRLDAIAYLWKKLGTPCIHLRETHEIVKIIRDVLALVAPDVILITETNVPHEENISYFGRGDEAHMVYQFSLPPLLLHALQTGQSRILTEWAASLGRVPQGCTFFNFSASHDGIGVRPLEGLISDKELNALVEGIRKRGGHVSSKTNADGSESPYELNITYFDALSDPENPDEDLHIARFLCSQAVVLALKGIPGIYIHSLLGTRNDEEGVASTDRVRSINRKQWEARELNALLDDKSSVTARVFDGYTKLLRTRMQHKAFHPDGKQEALDLGANLFALKRISPDKSETMVAINNFSSRPVDIPVSEKIPCLAKSGKWKNVITGRTRGKANGTLTLAPYETAWLQAPE